MTQYSYRVEPLVPTLDTFASVRGFDMTRPLTPEGRAFVIDALAKHLVLVFRDQESNEEAHERFAKALGTCPPQMSSWAAGAMKGSMHLKGDALYFTHGEGFANSAASDPASAWGEVDGNHSPRGFSCWHTDDTEKVDVARVSILQGVDVPGRGGATFYGDTQTAFEALDPEVRARLEDLRGVHFFAFPGAPLPVSQPLVRTNPITGRKSLYVNFNCMDRIEGMAKSESNDLLAMLYRHVTRPEFVYRHTWARGDCVAWNNVGSMHRREALVPGERRVLRRFQVEIPELRPMAARERTRELSNRLDPWSAYPFV